MQFTPLLGIGLALIVIGVVVLWRDMRRLRRIDNIENGPGHDNAIDRMPLAHVQITHPSPPAPEEKFAHSEAPQSALRALKDTIERASNELDGEVVPEGSKSKKTEADWSALGELIEKSVRDVNSILRDVAISIGSAGQAGWSFSNRGYGEFRRVMLAGQSVAWLRLELTSDGRFIGALRSHGDEKSALNANETISAHNLSVEKISQLIAASMQPVTKYAARKETRPISDHDVAQALWLESEELVSQALRRAGDALQESGAGLEAAGKPEWNDMTKRHRLVVGVLLEGSPIAQMYIERPTAREIECLVVPSTPDAGMQSQRQRVVFDKRSSTEFAELIVNCVWPSIECAWNTRQRAKRASI